jgi:TolA-binding protein
MKPLPPFRLRFIAASLLLAGALGAETAPAPLAEPAAPPAAPEHPAAPAEHAAPSADEHDREVKGLLTLGTTLTERGDYAAAEIAFRQLLEERKFAPADKHTALIGLARMYRRQGAFVKAAAIYERFIKDYPDEERLPDVMLDLGRTLRDMGAYKLAISRFYSVINSTLKLSSGGFTHYQQLARTAQFEIAETHFASGDFAEAGKFFLRLRLLDLAPADRARAHFMAARAQQLDHDSETAVTTLRSFLEQWPDDENAPEARYLLATTLRQLNRTDDALAVTLDLLKSEQPKTESDPRRWAYWQRKTGNQLANEFFQNGDTTSALAIYQGLLSLSSDAAWQLPVKYQVALCYERLHQPIQARALYAEIAAAAKPADGTPAPSSDLSELARMAEWRLNQIDWRDRTDRQLNNYFSTIPVPSPAAPPPPANDPDGSPAAASAAL